MKELFDNVYEDVCNSIQIFVECVECLGEFVLNILVYLTIPLWFIPYAIYKKGRANSESNSFNE